MRNIVGFLLLVHFFNYNALFLTESPENHKRDRFKGRKKIVRTQNKNLQGLKDFAHLKMQAFKYRTNLKKFYFSLFETLHFKSFEYAIASC
jgi:hypothetical protein